VQRASHGASPLAARAAQGEPHDALAAEVDLSDATSVGAQVQVEGRLGGEVAAPGFHNPGQVRAPELLLAVREQDDLGGEV
jgi:hypothetical protein